MSALTDDRLRELVMDITSDDVVLGQLDIADIRAALLELIELRAKGERT